ncbi:MAG: hypothetical protein QNJ69_14020 [Gammaproteobacteria bacterium]|nr:hypothetical protein [Gammaproteobacteria bacterium]
MQLSNEDNLRLNVLLAQDLKAVRIDESKMVVHALSAKGDAKVQLNPTCRDEKYVRLVKELLSNKIMGSPGGYPVYIKRWTRMGQERREESLAQLLLLGEQEAVIAVVHAPQLSAEIAAHAWWALPSADNARRLLEKQEIAQSPLARELAEFLLEFLPFEVEHKDMIDSVRLCLQPGLLSQAEIDDLWKRAKRKQSLYVGFLHTLPDQLPETAAEHPGFTEAQSLLQDLLEQDNVYARQLLRYLSAPGQAYLNTVLRIFDKAASQDTIVSMFHAFAAYNRELPLAAVKQRNLDDAEMQAEQWLADNSDRQLSACVQQVASFVPQIKAMLVLAQMGEVTLNPIFGLTDALGSVMRKKLKPLTDPLQQHIQLLLK